MLRRKSTYSSKYGSRRRPQRRARGRGMYMGGPYAGRGEYGPHSKEGTYFRDAGRRLGTMAGSYLGGSLGAMGGAALSKFTGNGMYNASGTQMNDLIHGGNASEGIMRFNSQRDHETITVSHSEYVMDLYAPAAGERMADVTLPLNPGLPQSFPMLSQLAANFESYRLLQCAVTYKPTIGNWQTERGMVGNVLIATQYNVNRLPAVTKEEMLATTGSQSIIATESAYHGIECDPKKLPTDAKHFVRTHPVSPTENLADYDHATTQIRVQDVPSGLNDRDASMTMGEIHISYTVELRKPRIYSGVGLAIPRSIIAAAAPPGGEYTNLKLSQMGVCTMPSNVTGKFAAMFFMGPGDPTSTGQPEYDKLQTSLIRGASNGIAANLSAALRPLVKKNNFLQETLFAGIPADRVLGSSNYPASQTASVHVTRGIDLNLELLNTPVQGVAGSRFFVVQLPANFAGDLEINFALPCWCAGMRYPIASMAYQVQGNIDPIKDLPVYDSRFKPADGVKHNTSVGTIHNTESSWDNDGAQHQQRLMLSGSSDTISVTMTDSVEWQTPNPTEDRQSYATNVTIHCRVHLRCRVASNATNNEIHFMPVFGGHPLVNHSNAIQTINGQNTGPGSILKYATYGMPHLELSQYNTTLNERRDGINDKPAFVDAMESVYSY